MRSTIVRAATGGIRGPPDPLRNPCKRPAYRPTPHTMQAFRSRSVVPPMTRLWAATHHEEAADVAEGVPGSRGGSERRRTMTNEELEVSVGDEAFWDPHDAAVAAAWAAPGVIDVDDGLVVEY